jgi:hypothetical protein
MAPGGPSMLLAAIADAPNSGKLSGDASDAGLGKIQPKRTRLESSAGDIGTGQPNYF